MALIGVHAQTEVRDQEQGIAERLPQPPQALLHDAVVSPRPRSLRVFAQRNAEEDHALHPHPERFLDFACDRVERVLILPWHGVDGYRLLDALAEKERVHQVLRAKLRFARKPPEGGLRPKPAGTLQGERHTES